MQPSCPEQEHVGLDEEVPGVVPVCFGKGVDIAEWGDLCIALHQYIQSLSHNWAVVS
jgi:hypothetical protein